MSVVVDNLRVGYGAGADVLHGVSLRVNEKSAVGVIGANGAGKSTLLNAICGFVPARAGEIHIAGKPGRLDPHELPTHGVGYLMEGHSVFPSLTVQENLLLGTWVFRGDRKRVKAALDAAYAHAPILASTRDVKAGLLSGGQQRLLELERLALISPSLIVLDEPSMGLAPKLVHDVFARVGEMRGKGATVIVVDQSARQVCELCDYIYVMRLGRIHTHGPATEFVDRIEEVVREFI